MEYKQSPLPARKTIALVAHDNKKQELLAWCKQHLASLAPHQLYATGTTGSLIERETGLSIHKLISGPLGGDQQLGALITEGRVDMLIFFWDPFEPMPHDPDVKALLRLAVTWNIPTACDRATADFIFTSPLIVGEYAIQLEDYSQYIRRKIK